MLRPRQHLPMGSIVDRKPKPEGKYAKSILRKTHSLPAHASHFCRKEHTRATIGMTHDSNLALDKFHHVGKHHVALLEFFFLRCLWMVPPSNVIDIGTWRIDFARISDGWLQKTPDHWWLMNCFNAFNLLRQALGYSGSLELRCHYWKASLTRQPIFPQSFNIFQRLSIYCMVYQTSICCIFTLIS